MPMEELVGPAESRPDDPPTAPESELNIDFVRSSGPGGQKVNKTSSKAVLRWSVGASGAFSQEQKEAIRDAAGKRLNAEDEIVLFADTERSQFQNRDAVVRRLNDLIENALAPRKERKPTKVSRSERRRRLDDKRRQGEKKKSRKPPQGEW